MDKKKEYLSLQDEHSTSYILRNSEVVFQQQSDMNVLFPLICRRVSLLEDRLALALVVSLYGICFYTAFLIKYLTTWMVFLSGYRFLGISLVVNIILGAIYVLLLAGVGGSIIKELYAQRIDHKKYYIKNGGHFFIISLLLSFLALALPGLVTCIGENVLAIVYLVYVEAFLLLAYWIAYLVCTQKYPASVKIALKFFIFPLVIISFACIFSIFELVFINSIMVITHSREFLVSSGYLCYLK